MLTFIDDAIFPQFRKMTIDDLVAYDKYYSHSLAPCCDTAPANLYAWSDLNGTLEASKFHDGILVRFNNVFRNNMLHFIVLSKHVRTDHLHELFNYQKDHGLEVGLFNQPTRACKEIVDDPSFAIENDRDEYEYILSTLQHSTMPGKEFSRQRRRMGYFHREHTEDDITIRHIDTLDNNSRDELIKASQNWSPTAGEMSDDNRERESLRLCFNTHNEFQRKILCVYINGALAGFGVYRIYGDTAIVGYIKVDYGVQYMFDFVTHALAEHLSNHNVPYINFEQDLGIPGLRDHKMRLRPIRFIEKINITPAD